VHTAYAFGHAKKEHTDKLARLVKGTDSWRD